MVKREECRADKALMASFKELSVKHFQHERDMNCFKRSTTAIMLTVD